jgi:hypothetical protein
VSAALHDRRYAIRRLRNSPGFSAVAIATVALAIGANTAMFSFVNGLLLRPLPYPDSDRIVRVLERLPTGGINGISTLNYLDWTKLNAVFESIAAEVGWRATLTGASEPVRNTPAGEHDGHHRHSEWIAGTADHESRSAGGSAVSVKAGWPRPGRRASASNGTKMAKSACVTFTCRRQPRQGAPDNDRKEHDLLMVQQGRA